MAGWLADWLVGNRIYAVISRLFMDDKDDADANKTTRESCQDSQMTGAELKQSVHDQLVNKALILQEKLACSSSIISELSMVTKSKLCCCQVMPHATVAAGAILQFQASSSSWCSAHDAPK